MVNLSYFFNVSNITAAFPDTAILTMDTARELCVNAHLSSARNDLVLIIFIALSLRGFQLALINEWIGKSWDTDVFSMVMSLLSMIEICIYIGLFIVFMFAR